MNYFVTSPCRAFAVKVQNAWMVLRCKHPTQIPDLTELGKLAISRIVRLVVLGDIVVFVQIDVPAGGARFEHHTHSLQIGNSWRKLWFQLNAEFWFHLYSCSSEPQPFERRYLFEGGQPMNGGLPARLLRRLQHQLVLFLVRFAHSKGHGGNWKKKRTLFSFGHLIGRVLGV